MIRATSEYGGRPGKGVAWAQPSKDEYRRKAEECRRCADLSRNQIERERWLKIAKLWSGLV